MRDLSPPGRMVIMGVLNCTPDSFSEGGARIGAGPGAEQPDSRAEAVRAGLRLVAEGADIVDVGGESTRPGAAPISAQEQLVRILAVVQALVAEDVFVSVDTCDARVAQMALTHGAHMVNDVSGGLCDPALLAVAARAGAWAILGHWPGAPARDHGFRSGGTTVAQVAQELGDRAAAAIAAGVRPDRIVLDPGFGFGKSGAENWALLRGLGELRGVGFPVLVGASRKRFLGSGAENFDEAELAWREAGTVAVTALAGALGAWGVRVHEPRASLAAAVAAADFAGKDGTHGKRAGNG